MPLRLARRLVLAALALALAAPPPTSAAPPAARAHDAEVRAAAAAFEAIERKEVAALSGLLDQLAVDPALVEPFRARDRERLLAAATPRFEKLRAERGITHLYFLDPEPARTCFLRVHAPALHGDVIARETLSQAIATKKIGFGKELGKTAFALRVVKPIRAGGEVVGYVELGEEIDHFLERMKRETGNDFGLLADKQRVDRQELARVRKEDRWDERPDVVIIHSTVWDEKVVHLGVPLAKLPAEGKVLPEWKEGARTYVGGAFPVRDARDRVVGALFVRREVK